MDNKVFNVNGCSKEQLEATLKLALLDEYGNLQKVKGWVFYPEKGFVLLWHVDNKKPEQKLFPVPLSYDMLTHVVWDWLESDDAKSVPLVEWEDDLEDSDVENEMGFRVYCEEWGHVNEKGSHSLNHYSIVAIKRINCWYGK